MLPRPVLAVLLAAAAPGCSVFTSYPSHTSSYLRAFERGKFDQAAKGYAEEASGGDELLYRLEAATSWQAGGAFAQSKDAFALAEKTVQDFDDRPEVSGRDVAEGLATAVLNDKALPYDGEGFERVLMNSLQAINYLMLGDVEGALVEIRRSAQRQSAAEKKIGEPSKDAPPENVFAQYLGGTLRELSGDVDNAYVDFKQIHARAPGLAIVNRDLLRIAQATGRSEDLRSWRADFGDLAPSESIATDRGESRAARGEIVVMFGSGMAPMKDSFNLPVPTGHTVTKIAVPKYVDRPDVAVALRVVVDGAAVGRTELLEDVGAVARESLDRRIAGIIARTIARAAARGVAAEVGIHQIQKHGSDDVAVFVAIFAGIWNVFVEQADLRSWLTLPRNFQMARVVAGAGAREVRLELLGAGDTLLASRDLGRIEIPAGSFVPVFARSVDRFLHAYVPTSPRLSESAP